MPRIIALILLPLLLAFGHADAGEKKRLSGKPPYASAYDGLLPAGVAPSPAADFHPSQLRGAHVALVPSANFNEWSRVWERWHDEKGEKFDEEYREQLQGFRNSSNPRNFSEQVIQVLQPHVGEIFIADDLPQARDAGAEYYLIVDGWLGGNIGPADLFSCWDVCFRATGSVHLLDGELRLLFSAEGSEKAKGKSGFWGQNFDAAMEGAIVKAIDGMGRQVTDGMRKHLAGSPVRPRP